jgi:fatty-acid desaturase
VDITWWSIKLLRFLGQASDVQDQVPHKSHREVAADAMD